MRIILTFFFLSSHLAFALITDDPEPLGNGHWEIDITLTMNSTTGAQTFELPHIEVNYGLGDNLQLKWESGVAMVTATGSPTMAGWEDSLFGVKWRFLNGGDNEISIGTYPQLGVRLFSSNDPDISGPRTYFMLPIEIKKGWGDFALDGEFGTVFTTDAPNGWMYGVCASYNFTKRIELLAEVHGQIEGTAGASLLFPPGLIIQIGTEIGFSDTIALIGAVGKTVLVPEGDTATTLVYAGVKLTL
jgi:hypothetical protein